MALFRTVCPGPIDMGSWRNLKDLRLAVAMTRIPLSLRHIYRRAKPGMTSVKIFALLDADQNLVDPMRHRHGQSASRNACAHEADEAVRSPLMKFLACISQSLPGDPGPETRTRTGIPYGTCAVQRFCMSAFSVF